MKNLIIIGNIANGNCLTRITVNGSEGFNYFVDIQGNFHIPLQVNSGSYQILIMGMADGGGTLTVDIQGDLSGNASPVVPMHLPVHYSQSFRVNI